VLLETTPKPARDVKDVLGYSSWGSTDPQNRVRSYGMSFVPGAIAANLVGTDGRTFRAPPESWVPTGDSANRASWYGGSPESLIGDLIREGVTGVSGYVAQPLLNGVVRPQILFPAYLSGFNLVESYYLAMPYLGWQTIVVGDPLCAPFAKKPLSRTEIEDGIDNATDMPALFSKRRLANAIAEAPGIPENAVALSLRAQVASQRGDPKAARERLKEAVQIAPRYANAWIQGALLDEQAGQAEDAIAAYEKVLEIDPNQVVALNNLAFRLASARKMPKEALVYARRAAALAPNNLPVLDTLAWIQHLTGDDENAAKVMAQVVRANLPIANVRLHAAVIFAAQGSKPIAQNELAAALKLNPALEQSDEVKQLRAKLGLPASTPRPSSSSPSNAAPPKRPEPSRK
jgi:Tfp pilus assembly protein PilF